MRVSLLFFLIQEGGSVSIRPRPTIVTVLLTMDHFAHQSFKGEDTVLNHLRFDFSGLVRLLRGLRLHYLPSSTACSKILLDFFAVCVVNFSVYLHFVCLIVV